MIHQCCHENTNTPYHEAKQENLHKVRSPINPANGGNNNKESIQRPSISSKYSNKVAKGAKHVPKMHCCIRSRARYRRVKRSRRAAPTKAHGERRRSGKSAKQYRPEPRDKRRGAKPDRAQEELKTRQRGEAKRTRAEAPRDYTVTGRGSAASNKAARPRCVMMEISRVARANTAERSGSSAGACWRKKGKTSAPSRPRASTAKGVSSTCGLSSAG